MALRRCRAWLSWAKKFPHAGAPGRAAYVGVVEVVRNPRFSTPGLLLMGKDRWMRHQRYRVCKAVMQRFGDVFNRMKTGLPQF